MRVHFWSSTEYSGFLEALVHELTRIGIPAKQRFQVSEASYRSAKKVSERLWLRLRQYLFYPIQLCISLIWERFRSRFLGVLFKGNRSEAEVIIVSTNTFYAPLLATLLHPQVVYLVYDLFPEAMIHSGKWKEGSLQVKIVRWITRQSLNRSQLNIFLGQRLKDYVEKIHGPVLNSKIIAVGSDNLLFRLSPKDRHKSIRVSSVPTLLYCGNFGNMHDSTTIFQYWKKLAESSYDASRVREKPEKLVPPERYEVQWEFYCSGPNQSKLQVVYSQLPEPMKRRICLGNGLDEKAWIEKMEAADVALITMLPGSQTVVMPSKTYSAMAAGQAILAIAPEHSDLVDLIKESDCGWFIEPGDIRRLELVLADIVSNKKSVLEKRENAYKYAHSSLGQDALAKQWKAALESL